MNDEHFQELLASVKQGGTIMLTIGAYEAKNHLPQLLDRVARGEKITITRYGVPVATLQPTDTPQKMPAREAVEQMRLFRHGLRLNGLSLREMIEEGRR